MDVNSTYLPVGLASSTQTANAIGLIMYECYS
jgi:hypothetical protein